MKIRTEFKGDAGDTMVVTFDDATKEFVSDQGASGSYEPDFAGRRMTISSTGFSGDIRFEGEFAPKVGAATRYSVSDGRRGVATILSLG